MSVPKIIFISWQGGMGHVTRDLAIVQELRRLNPEIQVSWLSHQQASHFLRQAEETLLPETELVADYNLVGAQIVKNFRLDLVKYAKLSEAPKRQNARLAEQVQNKYRFDLIVGDEIYGILLELARRNIQLDCPVIMIEDFISYRSLSRNPLMRLVAFMKNRNLVNYTEKTSPQIKHLFVGEWEDIPDRRFGYFLPHCREFARKHYQAIGHIVRFNPEDYRDKAAIRKKLGYGPGPLVICATGGTAAGKDLLELCGRAYSILKQEMPDLHMVFVCGELYGKEPPRLPGNAELHHFLPDIYEHYAACDLAVIVGGGTTSIELTALQRPFLFFPLENQFDQQLYVSERIARHGAGVRMNYRKTTPEMLAQAILENTGKKIKTKPFPIGGARKAAEIIIKYLNPKFRK